MRNYFPTTNSREEFNLRRARRGAGILPFVFVVALAAKLRCTRVKRLKSPFRRNRDKICGRTEER
jgi:hypothetical protein